MERTVDVTTARRQLGTLLDEVFHKGDSIIIERKGKVLARLAPATKQKTFREESGIDIERQQLLDQLHGLPTLSMDEDPTEVLRGIRSQKRLKAIRDHE